MNRARIFVTMLCLAFASSTLTTSADAQVSGKPLLPVLTKDTAAASSKEVKRAEASIRAAFNRLKTNPEFIAAVKRHDSGAALMMLEKGSGVGNLTGTIVGNGGEGAAKLKIRIDCSWPPLKCTITISIA